MDSAGSDPNQGRVPPSGDGLSRALVTNPATLTVCTYMNAIPAEAGIQVFPGSCCLLWIPAFAGMTGKVAGLMTKATTPVGTQPEETIGFPCSQLHSPPASKNVLTGRKPT